MKKRDYTLDTFLHASAVMLLGLMAVSAICIVISVIVGGPRIADIVIVALGISAVVSCSLITFCVFKVLAEYRRVTKRFKEYEESYKEMERKIHERRRVP